MESGEDAVDNCGEWMVGGETGKVSGKVDIWSFDHNPAA
jgi:hypothetical protein